MGHYLELFVFTCVRNWNSDFYALILIVLQQNLTYFLKDDYNPVAYTNNIKTALDSLKASLPRTLVQVVTMFDVSPLQNMSTGLVCDTMHR